MKDTIQISIATQDERIKELVIARLSEVEFEAFEERENELLAFIDAVSFDQSVLASILDSYGLVYTQTIIQEQNWNALWESSFQAVEIGDFCVIRADFHAPFEGKQHEIIITPKMSFGTGHHATTYLMISAMRQVDFKNKRVADFGTGTGVLAILAEKLGAVHVWGIDIDDWSIANATENVEKNNCKNIIIEKRGRFDPDERFDIILANINKNVILENVEALASGIKPSGKLLLSGLLKEDEKDIVDAFDAKGYKYQSTVERNKWICLLLKYGVNLH